jgi:hypothetical protein
VFFLQRGNRRARGTRLASPASMGTTDCTLVAAAFYKHLLQTLQAHRLPFMIGGAFAFAHYTGIRRPTKDLDIFIHAGDWERTARLAQDAGYRTELPHPHWLGKVHDHAGFVDVIFNSGNGLSPVDELWFQHALDAHAFGLPVKLAPVEESIWTKAFIMERERFDGADIAHLLHACASRIDWHRLLQRFGAHWRVLLVHLVMFGFIYPGERSLVPPWLMDDLMQRLRHECTQPAPRTQLCAGTLLSREQYLPDIVNHGYGDPRLPPHGALTPDDIAAWTRGASENGSSSRAAG